MKQRWEVKKLGEVIEIRNGKNQKEVLSETGQYPIMGSGGNVMGYATDYICEAGTTIIGRKGNISKPIFINKKFWNVDTAFGLYPKNALPEKFVYYSCLNIDFGSMNRGTTIPSLVKTELLQIPILVPKSLPEQQRIVAILDEAFDAIERAKSNAEQNLQNAKQLFESYLQGVFENKGEGWEEKKLGEVCDTAAGGTPLKAHKDYYEEGDVPWLRSGEVCQKDIFECEMFITQKGLKNSSARLFPANTVLIAMYGATAGQVGILRFQCSTNQAVCGILPNKNFIPEFLYYKFMAGKEALVSQAVGGAQPNISQIKIKNTFVPIISFTEQQTIVAKLDALNTETKKLEAIYKQKLADLEELKKSILQKAFSGEL